MTWKNYADKWPEELSKAQNGLKTDIAKGIYLYLLLNNDKAFTEISKDLDIAPNKLSYHLKNMVRFGLLSHAYLKEDEGNEYSFYTVSNFGKIYAKKVLEAAHSPYQNQEITVLPPISIRKKTDEEIIPMNNWATSSGTLSYGIRLLVNNENIKTEVDEDTVTTVEVVI